MPSWKAHILINLIFFVFWLKLVFSLGLIEIPFVLSLIPLIILLSVFPDIDTSKSKIRKLTSLIIAFLITLILLLFYTIEWHDLLFVFLLAYLLFRFFPIKHRGITHNIYFSIIFCFLTVVLIYIFFEIDFLTAILTFLILLFSYNSHLFFDKIV